MGRSLIDPHHIAEAEGLLVGRVILQSNVDGGLVCHEGYWSIFVNIVDRHRSRIRFTIAHETGHYFLHRHIQPSFYCRIYNQTYDGNPPEFEREANIFARELLMPAEIVRALVQMGVTDLVEMARRLGVSRRALAIRIGELGLTQYVKISS